MHATLIYAFTAGSGFLLMLTTLATPRRVNVCANDWLGLFLFSFACIMLDQALFYADIYDRYPWISGVLELTRLAMSPALYFAVVYFIMPERRFRPLDYAHFIPFTLFALFIVTALTGLNQSILLSWYHHLPQGLRQMVRLVIFASPKLQMIIYWLLSYALLIKHSRNIRLFASSVEPISLSWLRYYLLGLSVAVLLSVNELLIVVPAIVPLTHFGYLILTFYLGYFSLRQQEIYPYRPGDLTDIQEIIKEDDRPLKTQRFSDEELRIARHKLTALMENEKTFLDPNLGLPQLAAKASMSTHDLSFLINEGFQENFFQFVNRYRIEEAKRLLKSNTHKHLNILGIAYEVGFRSKSTFNTTFKKFTGQSPSAFMRTDDVNKKVA